MNAEDTSNDEIRGFIDDLVTTMSERHGPRSVWATCPRFLYHVTELSNISSILAEGRLLSRRRALDAGLLRYDSASADIIGRTEPWVLDSVRLYFRPRTPTFANTEGIRPTGQRTIYAAHCPIPVVLLFDAATVLSQPGIRCSDGNLARPRRRIGAGVDFLRSLPFEAIFDDAWASTSEANDRLVFHRNAEVAVPGELPLAEALRFIYVRSEAEYETLRTFIDVENADARAWLGRLVVDRRDRLFFHRWTYVHSVTLNRESAALRVVFNPFSEAPGPFAFRVEYLDRASGELMADERMEFRANQPMWLSLPSAMRSAPFRVRLLLDGCLAFESTFDPTTTEVLIRPD